MVIQVNSGACIDDRPISIRPCECVRVPKPNIPKLDVIKNNIRNPSILQQQNTQSDQKVYNKNRTKPLKSKKSGVWLTSEWHELFRPNFNQFLLTILSLCLFQ